MHSRSVPVLVPLISHWFTAVCRDRILVSLLQREQTDRWGAAENGGMSHHRERGVTSPNYPRLLHPLLHTARCMLGEDKGLDVKLSLPPQS